jgi:uncharacterized membrane protein
MAAENTLVVNVDDHLIADSAIRALMAEGFSQENLTVIGKGFHSEEKVTGFLHTSDRMIMWGKYGAFWGGLWGALFGGVFLTVPVVGPIVVLGYMASVFASMFEGAVVVGAVSAVVAAMVNVGIGKEHAIRYESAIKSNGFIVMVRGSQEELARAQGVLAKFNFPLVESHASEQVDHAIQELVTPAVPLIQ